jgi:patatin-like phospholipase/acyl hydrolase
MILSVDGGGSHGFFSYRIVQRLSTIKRTQVDLIVGVSAGAIVGALYAANKIDSFDLQSLQLHARLIFGTKTTKGPWFGPTYCGRPKTKALQDLFGDMLFGDLSIDTAILVDCLDGVPEIFKSWEPTHKNIPIVQILDATSAVPVLFPPVTIHGKQYMDGATVTNSPIGIAHLLGMSRFPNERLSLMSLGTKRPSPVVGTSNRRFQNNDMGIVQLVTLGIPSKLLRQGGRLTNELSISILGSRFLRIEGTIDRDLDEVHGVVELCACQGDKIWDTSENEINIFMQHLNDQNPTTTP